MGKNKLFSAMAAAIVGAVGIANMSNAININPDGSGQVLIYPYYTIDGGNDTLISVVNTANEVKAVKVRFHESYNSREPLDFNLYLSPFDVWTGVVTRGPGDNGTQLPILFTNDTSCTVPDIRTNPQLQQLADGTRYVNFSNGRFGNSPVVAGRSGYLEMLEMGVVRDVTPSAVLLPAGQPLFTPATWATHVNGVPNNCNALVEAFANVPWAAGSGRGIWAFNQMIPAPINAELNTGNSAGIRPATGGLFGSGLVINGSTGRNVSYAATALEGFNFPAPPVGSLSGSMHSDPSNLSPNLGSYGVGPQQANVFVGGRLVQSTYSPPNRLIVEAVSAVLTSQNIVNEYAFSVAGTAFTTEWVVTMPTKRFHTDNGPVVPPFSSSSAGGSSCEPIRIRAFDREEYVYPFVLFSPAVPPSLCTEVNVVNFEFLPPGQPLQASLAPLPGGATTVLGARDNLLSTRRIALPRPPSAPTAGILAGWAEIVFGAQVSPATRPSDEGDVWSGLPYIGFNVLGAGNTAGQISAFYAGAVSHRGQRRCENVAGC